MNADSRRFVVASLPAALVGLWNLGARIGEAGIGPAAAWQLTLLDHAGIYHEEPSVLAAIATGLAFLLPLLAVSLAVSRLWSEAFARLRRRALDPGWAVSAWLFTLLLPATVPLPYAALALSFGVVFGSHVFGGTGRYIVNPALLGLVFLALAYPPLMSAGAWLPGGETATTWTEVAREAFDAASAAGVAFLPLLLGREIGAIGATSALACLAGAAYLVAAGTASARVIVAALAGLAVGGLLAGGLPWHWHLVLGQFAFLLAFVATDPSTKPATGGGMIAYGVLFGLLTIALRTANPEHPEGSAFALLLAMLAIPLVDYVGTAWRLGRLPEPGEMDHDQA